MTLLDLSQLRQVLDTTIRDLFRWETLPAYEVASDGSDYRRYLDGAGRIERFSALIRGFQPAMVIGLTQTLDYARATCDGFLPQYSNRGSAFGRSPALATRGRKPLRVGMTCGYICAVLGQPYDRTKDLNHTNPTRRCGTTVAHPAQPWTPTVHALLRHLEAEGFDAAPRVIGSGFDETGDEVLSWIDGTIFAQSVWPNPEDSLHEVGSVLHRLHEASRTFTPPPNAQWMPRSLHTNDDHALISHGNIAPWHVVFRHGRPVGLTGWEYAGPVDPTDEVAVTAWYCVRLFDDDVAAEIGLPGADTLAEWLRSFLDGYALARAARAELIDRILRFAIRDNGGYARVHGLTRESRNTEALWTLAWQSRAALWTLEHRELLTQAALR